MILNIRISADVIQTYMYVRINPNSTTKYKISSINFKLVYYHKIASSNTSRLEANVAFFRWLMKGLFGPYVLRPFDKKLIF